MSRFRDDFAIAFADVLFEMGDQIKICPIGERKRVITAIVNEKMINLKGESHHDTKVTVLEVKCLKAAVPTPREGDYAEWGNEQWDFEKQLGDEGDVLTMIYVKTDTTQAGKRPSNL